MDGVPAGVRTAPTRRWTPHRLVTRVAVPVLVGLAAALAAPGSPAAAAGSATVTGAISTGATPAAVAGSAPAVTVPARQDDKPVKWYRVRPAVNGEPEFLFAIAERLLGDGDRNAEIFELNKGRVQPDGKRMTDPAVIEPGWILVLPADASGDGVESGPLPEVSATPGGDAADGAGDPGAVGDAAGDGAADRAAGRAGTDDGTPVLPIALAVASVLVAFAAVWLLLMRRRAATAAGPGAGAATGRPDPPAPAGPSGGRPWQPPAAVPNRQPPAAGPGWQPPDGGPAPLGGSPGPVAATPAAAPAAATRPGRRFGLRGGERAGTPAAVPRHFDTAAAWTVDRALRVLATGCAGSGTPYPDFYAVGVYNDRVLLRLSAPGTPAPAPWHLTEDGLCWLASLRDVQAAPIDADLTLPAPRLVTLGTADGARILLDLARSGGVVGLGGQSRLVRALLAGWVTELVDSPWSAHTRVLLAGVRDVAVTAAGADRVRVVPGAREVTAAVDALGDASGAAGGGGGPATPAAGVLVLGTPPGGREAAQLWPLLSGQRPGWSTVVLDAGDDARWSLTMHPDGVLDTGVLGIRVNTGLAATGPGR